MEDEKELFEVFTLKCANYLAYHGHWIVGVQDDRRNPHYKTFLFRNTPEMKACLAEFKKER